MKAAVVKRTINLDSVIYKPEGINTFNRAESICSAIMLDAFKGCHDKVDPGEYKLLCMQDVALCNFDLHSDCMCGALSSYSRACNDAGVALSWRNPELCRKYSYAIL